MFHRTRQVAEMFGCSREHVHHLARSLNLGFNVGGSSGYRFSDADVAKMRDHMSPTPEVERRRRTRTA